MYILQEWSRPLSFGCKILPQERGQKEGHNGGQRKYSTDQ